MDRMVSLRAKLMCSAVSLMKVGRSVIADGLGATSFVSKCLTEKMGLGSWTLPFSVFFFFKSFHAGKSWCWKSEFK